MDLTGSNRAKRALCRQRSWLPSLRAQPSKLCLRWRACSIPAIKKMDSAGIEPAAFPVRGERSTDELRAREEKK